MKNVITRIRKAQFLFFLLLMNSPSLYAQSKSNVEENAPAFLYELTFEEEALESALFQILFSQTRFTVVGNQDVVVNAEIKARTEEDAVDQLAQQMDWLVTRRGTRYFVYVDGAEEELGDRSINYMFKCRSVRAGDILQILEGKSPAGFPQPAQLGPSDGRNVSSGYNGSSNFGGNGSWSDSNSYSYGAGEDPTGGYGSSMTCSMGRLPRGTLRA